MAYDRIYFFSQIAFLLRKKQKKRRENNDSNQNKSPRRMLHFIIPWCGFKLYHHLGNAHGRINHLGLNAPHFACGNQIFPKMELWMRLCLLPFSSFCKPLCTATYLCIAKPVLCALLDYILPFSALGITAFAKKGKIYHYFTLAIAIRFVCHFLSGVLIWGQWAVNMSPTLYSLAYNGSFLLPELLITFAVTGPLFEMKVIRKLLNLPTST